MPSAMKQQKPQILAWFFPDFFPERHTTLPKPQMRSERIKRRRGLTLLAMSLVLPGSAQLVAGNRRIGRLALRVWAALGFVALLAGLLAIISPKLVLSMITFGPTLTAMQVGLITLGLGWAALIMRLKCRKARRATLSWNGSAGISSRIGR